MSCHVGSTHPTAHGLAFQCSSRRCWGEVDVDVVVVVDGSEAEGGTEGFSVADGAEVA